jgi:hypothetical protein
MGGERPPCPFFTASFRVVVFWAATGGVGSPQRPNRRWSRAPARPTSETGSRGDSSAEANFSRSSVVVGLCFSRRFLFFGGCLFCCLRFAEGGRGGRAGSHLSHVPFSRFLRLYRCCHLSPVSSTRSEFGYKVFFFLGSFDPSALPRCSFFSHHCSSPFHHPNHLVSRNKLVKDRICVLIFAQ